MTKPANIKNMKIRKAESLCFKEIPLFAIKIK